MFLQSRAAVVWVTWLFGGACGVILLLLVICYCRSMPRPHKSFDEQYLKETYTIKENHVYSTQGNYGRVKHTEQRAWAARPASYAGDRPPARAHSAAGHGPVAQYASSGVLDELEGEEPGEAGDAGGEASEASEASEALKTRSLPASLRPRPRPLSTETDLCQLYAKTSVGKQQRSRMRSEHAALIALSRARGAAPPPGAAAVIVYDQRTQL